MGRVYQMPFLAFVCVETDGMDRSSLNLIYTTYWYIDDKVAFSFENETSVTTLTEKDLLQKGFGLGIMIRCAAKMASSPAGLKTNLTTSKNFFAGIEASTLA
ncbi:uncharacterized protein LOC128550446 [Mercenaria mercenaria]|uniref:uncharacterized protein LOC128550446 n=1 Tax=Mercenaria mercenaria TaxID=6596 RepID=UPI00234EB064|nr:uncharacterized protein LOC128550446 [Mercenaria mercenaria]